MDIRTDFGGGDDFGHADYRAAREYGISNSRIRDFLDANPSKLIGKNIAGGGGLYDEIVDAGRARDFRGTDTPRINSKYGWVGNTNAFNPDAAYGPIEEPIETTNTNTLDEELDNNKHLNPILRSLEIKYCRVSIKVKAWMRIRKMIWILILQIALKLVYLTISF